MAGEFSFFLSCCFGVGGWVGGLPVSSSFCLCVFWATHMTRTRSLSLFLSLSTCNLFVYSLSLYFFVLY